ncbi:MAG TPA: hypothetical protein VNX02_12335 [Steroidobacteraceae bacterium]|jgi:hypothetical protein|nr:hypothetical protein [Steroidobacteraceae bacterium]
MQRQFLVGNRLADDQPDRLTQPPQVLADQQSPAQHQAEVTDDLQQAAVLAFEPHGQHLRL